MPQPLITIVTKTPLPSAPLGYEDTVPIVQGNASVPVELSIKGTLRDVPVGVDIVFVIDNSGSMDPDPPHSDPNMKRISAIKILSDAFAPTRDALDRIAIVTFRGSDLDGDIAVEVDTPSAPWKTWSQTATRIQTLMNSSVSGKTPIEEAMRKANNLLVNSNGFYRIAILISDGLPVPDDDTYPQTSNIVNDIIPNECIPNRILYSTIYLYTQSPEDNALLIHIAKETDYITPYLPGDPPAYYFRITSPNEIVNKYRILFEAIQSRGMPQDVRISEKVNSRLIIDPDVPVSFFGNGFSEEQNLLGGMSLNDLIEQFRSTSKFNIHLNELRAEVVFRFAVKLDLASVTDVEFTNGYVYTDVDVLTESFITWLQPITTAGSTTCMLVLPQARIKFLLGLNVTKELDENGTTTRICASNIDSRPIKYFQLAEYPSSYANFTITGDDFDFHPFSMLYEKRILPWFLQYVPVAGLNLQERIVLLNTVRNILRISHRPVLNREAEIDKYLCQFDFYEIKPGSQIYDPFWNSSSQRGIYKIIQDFPPKTSRCLKFDINGASYLLVRGSDQMLAKPADALEAKGMEPMSKYTAEGLDSWKKVYPNPTTYQIVSDTPEADLFLHTCFSDNYVNNLMLLFKGNPLPTAWAMLDSADVVPIWQHTRTRPRIGQSVTIYNCGDATSDATKVRARSFYLPFTGEEFSQTPHQRQTYKASPPFYGTAEAPVTSIQGHSSWSTNIIFRDLYYVKDAAILEKVPPTFLNKVKDTIIITIIDIVAPANESIHCNNSAIEIVAIRCT